MKASRATSATAATPARPTGRSSARRPSPTSAKGFALTGPSDPPDPATHAYRPDLADAALAHQVIASHYAEPLERAVARPAILRSGPSDQADALLELEPGDRFAMLDNSLGWAWGYGGASRRVGYVRAELIGAP
ncbi:MAG TPA: hypothetical protein VMN38_04620 [Sphingomicrobium sp.]|nr:hypothetical protein [Sphingomicrobium sp.]